MKHCGDLFRSDFIVIYVNFNTINSKSAFPRETLQYFSDREEIA